MPSKNEIAVEVAIGGTCNNGMLLRSIDLTLCCLCLGDKKLETRWIRSKEGIASWYKSLEFSNIPFPEDISQVPDVFINVYEKKVE